MRTAFSGEGARRYGGRWSSGGLPVVYTAGSLALAELEILVNLPTDRLLGSYVAFRARFSGEFVEALAPEGLPGNWRRDLAPRQVKAVGDRWVREERSLVLKVPSAVVPSEYNYLINPEHQDFHRVEIDGPLDPEIDARLG